MTHGNLELGTVPGHRVTSLRKQHTRLTMIGDIVTRGMCSSAVSVYSAIFDFLGDQQLVYLLS
jgi:uncharacterized protein (UPF0218 family)